MVPPHSHECAAAAYDCWLGTEPDPRDLLEPFPSELMAIWPISTRVNSPSKPLLNFTWVRSHFRLSSCGV